MKEKIFKTEYNPRTKRYKQMNLEKMAKETSDFVRHLNFIFLGTQYRVGEVREGRDKNHLKVYVTLSEKGTCEENKDYGILLTNNGISVGD